MRSVTARGVFVLGAVALLLSPVFAPAVHAQGGGSGTRMDIYGFAMLDMGYQSGQNDPNWFDVLRPTKLPAFGNQFGEDGRWFSGVRQSRLGFKTWTPTDLGELYTVFEFELFGVGVDAGQTTIRLRHAYGELGAFGAGQTWSPFMDIDVFPNSIEYWGPNGMVFFRNVQVRWMPLKGETRATIALERPGASGDAGVYGGEAALDDVQGRFPLPDLSAEYHRAFGFGYIEVAGIARRINWDDLDTTDGTDLSGSAAGWGFNVSSNIRTGERGTLRLQGVYGEGIQNYMNDATVDLAAVANPQDASQPFKGEVIPMFSVVAFYDINWNPRWSSTIGGSMLDMDLPAGQSPDAFKTGYYALANILHYPAKNVMLGLEGQYGRRENNSDGFTSDDFRVQFSAKYNFSYSLNAQ